jgi:hypothetical protein
LEPSGVKGIAVGQVHFMERMKELTRDRAYSTDLQARMRRQALKLGSIVIAILTLSLLVPLFVKIAVRYFF